MSKARRKRAATAAARKQRRKKVVAFGGLGVLAILMFIQGPKLLDAFRGPSAPIAALPVTPAGSAPQGDEPRAPALRALSGAAADPFASHSLANHDPQARSVSAPAGSRDPFALPAVASATKPAAAPKPDPVAKPVPGKIVVGTPKPGAVAKRAWIVVLASIQTRSGQDFAARFATRVRRNGLSVSVLDSSTRKSLRSGYYVVYTGPFATLAAVQRSAAHVHAFGYRTAYVRAILRY